jgi:hypothetical protein
MRKLYLLATIVLMLSFAPTINASLNVDTLKVDTLQLNKDQAFNLCYYSLEYWWEYAKLQDSIMIQKDSMLKKYVDITGIQAQKQDDIESIYNLKKQIEIDQQEKVLNEEVDRKKKWRKRTFVVSAIAILEGVIIYLIVSI